MIGSKIKEYNFDQPSEFLLFWPYLYLSIVYTMDRYGQSSRNSEGWSKLCLKLSWKNCNFNQLFKKVQINTFCGAFFSKDPLATSETWRLDSRQVCCVQCRLYLHTYDVCYGMYYVLPMGLIIFDIADLFSIRIKGMVPIGNNGFCFLHQWTTKQRWKGQDRECDFRKFEIALKHSVLIFSSKQRLFIFSDNC